MDDFIADRPAYGSLSATPPPVAAPKRTTTHWPWIVALVSLAFAFGLLLSPWFETEVRGRLFGIKPSEAPGASSQSTAQARTLALLQTRINALEHASVKGGSDPARIVRAEAQVNELQSKVGALGVRVEGAVTDAAQDAQTAQSVMLAAATRRSIETGQPLGPLEPPLRARFGQSYPGPVEALVVAGNRPTTLTRLQQDFERIEASIGNGPAATSSWWDMIKSAIGEIASVRRAGDAHAAPAELIAQAAQRLANGDVAGAAVIVTRLPASPVATGWLADARRYGAAQAALAQIEAAALAPPSVSPALAGTTAVGPAK